MSGEYHSVLRRFRQPSRSDQIDDFFPSNFLAGRGEFARTCSISMAGFPTCGLVASCGAEDLTYDLLDIWRWLGGVSRRVVRVGN